MKIKLEIKEDIGHISWRGDADSSQVVITKQGLTQLDEILSQLEKKKLKGALFYSEHPGSFFAGVDVKLIQSLSSEQEAVQGAERGQELFNRIEDLSFPTVACIDGTCLGGGLELALACDWRVVTEQALLGLPEVKLGILPGFGGTYRLPRLLKWEQALPLLLTGKMLSGKRALRQGLADQLTYTERLLDVGQALLKPRRRSLKQKLKYYRPALLKKLMIHKARVQTLESTQGVYPAPLKILDTLEKGLLKRRRFYLHLESASFGELFISQQSEYLRHLYFLTEAAKKKKFQSEPRLLKQGAVLGAGTMGGGLAWLFAENNQYPVMKDLNLDALELGLRQCNTIFSGQMKRRKITGKEKQRKLHSVLPTLRFESFRGVDLVIEAVVEKLEVKQSVFRELEPHLGEYTIVTSNTSSLSVSQMAQAFQKPERFAGLHFFNPVHRMPLVEIISHETTSDATLAALYQWVLNVKKIPLLVKDGPGFLVNRLLMPMINEALYLLEEGISFAHLDQVLKEFGMPMGPCRLMDEIGLDVLVKVGKIMYQELGERAKPGKILPRLVDEQKIVGKKQDQGFYRYKKGQVLSENSELQQYFPQNKRDYSDELIKKRLLYPMINEAARILKEGKVATAADVDLGMIYGIGFPPFRGGLLKYAERKGKTKILEGLNLFAQDVSVERFSPSEALQEQLEKGFYS